MLNKYISIKDFSSCLNIPENKIIKSIKELTEKDKSLLINEEDNILLDQNSINVFSKIVVEDLFDLALKITSKISCDFQWDRDKSSEKFWVSPLSLNFNLSKLFFSDLILVLKKEGFKKDMETFGFLKVKKDFRSSSDLWVYVQQILNKVKLYGNKGMGVCDANYFGDDKFRKYRSRLSFKDNFILSMHLHDRSKQRYGYKPSDS